MRTNVSGFGIIIYNESKAWAPRKKEIYRFNSSIENYGSELLQI